MKKEYTPPQAKAYIIKNSVILASSPTVGSGSTSEQDARRLYGFSDEEDEY